jgi:hypothetical protein
MPDITVQRHGDRWSVAEEGAGSPSKEFPTREAAEMAARQMAAGGTVEVREEDPTGLADRQDPSAGEPTHGGAADAGGEGSVDGPGLPGASRGDLAGEEARERQSGL